MNIDDAKKQLTKTYPQIRGHVTDDTDAHGNRFSELVIPNPNNPEYPLTVTVNENGCLLSWGAVEGICGGEQTVQSLCEVISDIMSDGFTLVTIYRNEDEHKARHAGFCEMYETDGDELAKLLSKLRKPLGFLENLGTKWKGIIEVTDWSGDNYEIYNRFFQKKS